MQPIDSTGHWDSEESMNCTGNEYGSTVVAHVGQFELVNIRRLCRNDFCRRATQESPVETMVLRRIDRTILTAVWRTILFGKKRAPNTAFFFNLRFSALSIFNIYLDSFSPVKYARFHCRCPFSWQCVCTFAHIFSLHADFDCELICPNDCGNGVF